MGVPLNKRLRLAARGDYGMNLSSARRGSGALRSVGRRVEVTAVSRLLTTAIATLCVTANVCLGQSPRPAPAMVSLTKALAGTWTTTYDTFIPDAPSADSTARGDVVWEAGPGGFTLLEKERVATASGEQFLLLIVWWDDSTHRLRAMRCDNAASEACDVTSHANTTLSWDGKALVLDFGFVDGNRQMRWHGVWSDITATSFVETGDVGEAKGRLERVLRGHAMRVARWSQDSSAVH